MLGETEVKAQIKLRLITEAGAPVVVERLFQVSQPCQVVCFTGVPAHGTDALLTWTVLVCSQLTQKKAALQFKALDQVIQSYNKDTGAKEALAYRCADVDRLIPNLMGVSKVCICLTPSRSCKLLLVSCIGLLQPAAWSRRLHALIDFNAMHAM